MDIELLHVSIPNGQPQPFSLLFSEYSMGSRQKQCFPRVSFLGGVLPSTTRTSPVLLSRGAACGVPRESERGAVISEALGRMDQLRPQTAPPRLAGALRPFPLS